MVAEILAITSAPNGCCLFSIDSTATGVPVVRSSRVATTVVVPRSKARPNARPVVSPGSTAISVSSATTAVTLKSDWRSVLPRVRSTARSATGLEVGQLAEDPFEVGHLVGERRLGEFQVALADGGAEDDLTADADRGGLGAGGQRRHLDVGVADGQGAAGEPPAVLDLLGGVGAQVEAGRQRRVRLEPDAALLAGAVAAAGGVDRDAVPARRVEEGDPLRHPHRAAVEPEVDPLAHGSTGIASGGSSVASAAPSRRGTPRSRRRPSRRGRAAGRRPAPP